ncbi:MAG: formimidoylglutamate deiminase [Paracoccaceae bacterium]|nr:MAG: formimidoylglutamate deiminase [Paracoccaceae bacterium]
MQWIRAGRALLPDGWAEEVRVAIAGGRIHAVETGGGDALPPGASGPGHRVDILLPAPVNLHSHAFQRAMAGLTESRGPRGSDSFWTWRQLMYRFLDRLTPDQVETIATLAFMEMLEAGYAAVAEFHYLHHDRGGAGYARPAEMAARIAAAAERTGIGLTLLPVLYMQGGCDGRPLEGGQLRFGCDLDRFARLHQDSAALIARAPGDFAIGVAPHSLRAVPPQALARLDELAPRGPVHMHLAEQEAEVAEVEARLGARPVAWALDNLPLGPRWCLIHCTQMTGAEAARLARTGAVAGLCPITEANLGDGIFPGAAFQDNGGRFGVGTDSNVRIALWDELMMLEYSQRLGGRIRAALAGGPGRSTGRTLFAAALTGGAQAAGRDSGAIRPGLWADLLGLSAAGPDLCGRHGDRLIDALVFAGAGHGALRDLWSAGRHVVQGGRHVLREEILRAHAALAPALAAEA